MVFVEEVWSLWRRCGLVGGAVTLGVDLEDYKAHTRC